jgi:predicted HAD superfamily Cof-like phosphohydrolase|tara:strand:- start:40 stop:414 length:375 start_codon:yes stop_codon:yes gene_type:complete
MKKVKEFHKKMELAIDQPYSKELMNFRLQLFFEEIQELATAALDVEEAEDTLERAVLMQKLLKEMCDVVYVIKGMAVSFGMDFEEAFKLVHESNMSKLPLLKDADGKVQKGLNYEPPILEGLIN